MRNADSADAFSSKRRCDPLSSPVDALPCRAARSLTAVGSRFAGGG